MQIRTETKLLSAIVGAVIVLGLAVVPALEYNEAFSQEAKPQDKGKQPPKQKPTKVQARVNVIIDGTAVNATDLGNSTVTTTVGGHTQSKVVELENDTDTSAIQMPFNFNRLTSQAGDQFSTCFNSDILDTVCDDGTLISAQKGKGKGNAPTKLQGTANLVLG